MSVPEADSLAHLEDRIHRAVELVAQLRGEAGPRQVEGARIALVENGGGLRGVEEAAVAITILERA